MIDSSTVLALIPARGGSKGVPRKNILIVNGRPLIEYTIEEALAAKSIGRVIVSTDDPDIAEISLAAGAEIPFTRPSEFSGDLSPDIDVFNHALDWLQQKESWLPELVVHLRPTSPGRDPADIDRAVETIARIGEADSLRGVSPVDQHPYKMWRIENDRLKPFIDDTGVNEAHNQPRQLLPAVYWGNGYVDVIRTRTILEQRSMYGETVIPFHTGTVVDFDDPMMIPILEAKLAGRGSVDTATITRTRKRQSQ